MKKKILYIGIAVFIVAIAGYYFTKATQAVVVETAKVAKGDITKYIEDTATVKCVDQRSVSTVSQGLLTDVYVTEGSVVRAGDILAKLDDREINLQIKELKAEKLLIEAGYLDTFSQKQMDSDMAAYNQAKKAADNNKKLFEQGIISSSIYDDSLVALAAKEAALTATKNRIDSSLKQYNAQISAVNSKLLILQQKAQQLTVKAPIDGIILYKASETGSFVQMGSELFILGDSSKLYLESDILAGDLSSIKVGAPVVLENIDMNITGKSGIVTKIFPAAISKLSELGIEQKRVKIEIKIIDNIPELKPGFEMNIKIAAASSKNTLILDSKGVFALSGKDYVFVNENGKAKLRQITKGLENDEKVEVLTGLKEGEAVILSPDSKIKEGSKIKTQ